MDTPTNTLEEKRKPLVAPIDLNKFATLRNFKQKIIIAEKINELINILNLQ